MKRVSFIFISVAISFSFLSRSFAQQSANPNSTVTLYSVNKHHGEPRNFCFNFKGGPSTAFHSDCDLKYGLLYAGDDLDWFESSSSPGDRSVIRDLGDSSWTAEVQIPVVEPLPKLKPGEQRHFTVDTSGADGADGAPGAPGKPGADADGVVRVREIPATPPTSQLTTKSTRPKHDGKPKADPIWVKAVIGHLYVIHVVDETRDFYALFRVENLQRGDSCTVSWKLIQDPVNQTGTSPLR